MNKVTKIREIKVIIMYSYLRFIWRNAFGVI